MPYASEVNAENKKLVNDLDNFSFLAPYSPSDQQMYRTFRVSLVIPNDDDITQAPMVLWSHGCVQGSGVDEQKKTNWARFFAKAGYIVVMISHTRPQSDAEIEAIRHHLRSAETPDEQSSDSWNFMNYLRILDIKHVVANISTINEHLSAREDIDIVIDPNAKYVLAGHGPGAGAALTYAGAIRYWHGPNEQGTRYSLADEGLLPPSAFLCYSVPSQRSADHWGDNSFASVAADTPVLTLTGLGDVTDTIVDANTRKTVYNEMVAAGGNNKYLLWIDDDEPDHCFFNHTGATIADFEEYSDNMIDISIAFLDRYIHDSEDARDYLCGGGMQNDLAPDVIWQYSE